MPNANKYPDYIMDMVRQHLGLEEGDTSRDAEINSMSRNEVFERVCRWDGLLGSYHDTIRGWVKDIYGVDLSELVS